MVGLTAVITTLLSLIHVARAVLMSSLPRRHPGLPRKEVRARAPLVWGGVLVRREGPAAVTATVRQLAVRVTGPPKGMRRVEGSESVVRVWWSSAGVVVVGWRKCLVRLDYCGFWESQSQSQSQASRSRSVLESSRSGQRGVRQHLLRTCICITGSTVQ